jgi:predicted TPR repeat methyltransferase
VIAFPPQPEGAAAGEVVEVDGRRLRLHDYAALYAVPGLYEAVVQDALGCRAPEVVAGLLATAAAGAPLRVVDLGAGNGVSGDALRAHGLDPVVAIDLLPAARAAALRDRPGLYREYLTADTTALAPGQEAAIRAQRPQALALVGALGGDHVPPPAVEAVLALLEPPALLAYAFDVGLGDPLRIGRELARERYVHRRTAPGGERIWEAVVAQASVRTLPDRAPG